MLVFMQNVMMNVGVAVGGAAGFSGRPEFRPETGFPRHRGLAGQVEGAAGGGGGIGDAVAGLSVTLLEVLREDSV